VAVTDLGESQKKILGYSADELMEMDPVMLRTLLHERTHHTIEVLLYRVLTGKMKMPKAFGEAAENILDIWKSRGLPMDAPDIAWSIRYVDLAEKLRSGGHEVDLGTKLPQPFSEAELKTVRKLVYERRSIRQWSARPVSRETLREVLYAGLMAPQGCNVGSTRFIVLRDPMDWRLVETDIPLENGVMIIVCQDMRVYKVVRFDEAVPQNIFFDAAAAADHMLLMAHALGLGGVWLTHGEAAQKKIRERFRLPEHIVSRLHVVVGWPAEAPIKSARMGLDDVILVED
jgi:nitroreductase